MANIHILASPASDGGAFSGGAWNTSLPLANVQTQQPSQVARTLDLAAASTRFTLDLGSPQPVGLIALIAHNGSSTATVRYRISDAVDGSSPALDTTGPLRRPNLHWGARPWGAYAWEGFDPAIETGGPIALYRPAATLYGRYVFVDVADAGNAAGYLQIGRVMIGLPVVPRFNMLFGAGIGLIDESKASRSTGGQAWFDRRPQRRRGSFAFGALSEIEAWGAFYAIQRRVGLTGNLLVAYDPDDGDGTAGRRTLYGTLASLPDIVTATASPDAPYTWNLAVEELI